MTPPSPLTNKTAIITGSSAGIGKGIAAPLVGAIAKVTGMIKKEHLAKIVSDVSGMERGYNEVKIRKLG